jgi:hypothetical protein
VSVRARVRARDERGECDDDEDTDLPSVTFLRVLLPVLDVGVHRLLEDLVSLWNGFVEENGRRAGRRRRAGETRQERRERGTRSALAHGIARSMVG